MFCTRSITDTLTYVGGCDRRLSLFEGAYPVPYGVRYNSYVLTDEKCVLFDTVDDSVRDLFLENVAHTLGGRALDYIVVQHMEPDHSASLAAAAAQYPEAVIVASAQAKNMIGRFFGPALADRVQVVKEGDTLQTGTHTLRFVAAPMVHWPEVLVTYDETDKTLFSADAFGVFGAADGAIFADEIDFEKDYMDEARRYYTNIVGKYGPQVQALLKKASALEIAMICPLHGFVFRGDFGPLVEKYDLWSRYEPEENRVAIFCGSIYGNTKNAATVASRRTSTTSPSCTFPNWSPPRSAAVILSSPRRRTTWAFSRRWRTSCTTSPRTTSRTAKPRSFKTAPGRPSAAS